MKRCIIALFSVLLISAFAADASPGESTVIQKELSIHKADVVHQVFALPVVEVAPVPFVLPMATPMYNRIKADAAAAVLQRDSGQLIRKGALRYRPPATPYAHLPLNDPDLSPHYVSEKRPRSMPFAFRTQHRWCRSSLSSHQYT